ncbi:MAG TPA: DUF177 domain-containing protein [Anaerolineales bacterium]|nr:DUF177 domain-containing protein [Anaerolineales bacterium]
MQFNVAQLMKERTGAKRQYELDEDVQALYKDFQVKDTLRGEVTFIRTSDGVLVTGELDTSVEMVCDRCLEPIEPLVTIQLEEEFRPTIDIVTGIWIPQAEENEEATRIDEHHILDLTEVVRQGLMLAEPMHPLCQADCKGLCPNCGKNLNEGPCECEPELMDDRWAGLEVLRNLLNE